MAFTRRSQRFISVVQQTETKTNLSFSRPDLRFSCWLTSQRNVRWLSGQWLVWSGYIILQLTRITTTNEMARILTTLEKSTPPFITVTTKVRKHTLERTTCPAAELWNEKGLPEIWHQPQYIHGNNLANSSFVSWQYHFYSLPRPIPLKYIGDDNLQEQPRNNLFLFSRMWKNPDSR